MKKLFFLIVILILCQLTVSANDQIVVYPTSSSPQDVENIQQALDEIEPGGTVLLAAGTFDFGNSGVEVIKECTLKGEKGPGGVLLTTIIYGGYWNWEDFQPAIWVKSGDVTIKNLLFDETGEYPILIDGVLSGKSIVKDNIINSFYGIDITNNSGQEVIIKNNIINSRTGIYCWDNSNEEIQICNNVINSSDSYGYRGVSLDYNDCELKIINNEISNYRYGILGLSGFNNPAVEIKNNTIHQPYFSSGIQLGHSMVGWSNCLVKGNTLKSLDGQVAYFGIASFSYSGHNEIINNDLSEVHTCMAQAALGGRNDKLINNTFGFANEENTNPFDITHTPTAVSLWSIYFHPQYGNPYPEPTEYNIIKKNDYRNCGLPGWEANVAGDTVGGCILVFAYPDKGDPNGPFWADTSGPPNEVRFNYINETKKFPGNTGPQEQILVIQSNDPFGNPLVHDNIIIGYNQNKSANTSLTSYDIDEEYNTLESPRIYPNPFTTTITLSYTLAKDSDVIVQIFNSQGKQVDKIIQRQPIGLQKVEWDSGGLPAGLYYIILKTNEGIQTKKIIKL